MNQDTKTYPVLSTIRKDGIEYKPDPPHTVSIALTDREAGELRKLGAIGEPIALDSPSPQPSPAGEGENKPAKGGAKLRKLGAIGEPIALDSPSPQPSPAGEGENKPAKGGAE